MWRYLSLTYLLTPATHRGAELAIHHCSPSNTVADNPSPLFPVVIHSFHVFFQFPTQCLLFFPFSFPSGFQIRVCLVRRFDVFRDAYPIHAQHLLLIKFSAGRWFVLFHSILLLMACGTYSSHNIFMILWSHIIFIFEIQSKNQMVFIDKCFKSLALR